MKTVEFDRLDAWEKVRGQARYAADHKLDGLLYAFALQATISRGMLTAIDTARAQALPGIVSVFTHLNASEMGWTQNIEADRLGAEMLGRHSLGIDDDQPFYRPLCGPEILFAGQWIAIVVAETIEAARKALCAIDVTVAPIADETPDTVLPGPFFGGDMQYSRGDERAASGSTASVCQTYDTPLQLHQPMEPSATTASWNGDSLTLFDSTQGTRAVRGYVAASLGVAEEAVRVVAPYVGGGFGAKNQVWPHQALAAHIARRLGRPVCLQLTRADMAVASGYRSETRQEIELHGAADGTIKALKHVSHVPTSLRGGFFEPCGLNSLMLYRMERVEVSHRVTRSPVATPTPFRAPGETPGSFALETALDELAFKLRMDPLQLRIQNFADRDQYHDRPWSSNNLLQCYREGAERFGWPGRFIEPGSMMRNGLRIGYGMATTAYPAPALPASVRITLDLAAGLVIETSATDIGTGMRTILAQTAATELQVDLSRIVVNIADSNLPNAPTAGRSKSTASVLPAVLDACREIKRQLGEHSEITDEGVNLTGPFERLDAAGVTRLTATGSSEGMPKGQNLSYYSFGAHFVEVAVDPEIGCLRVLRVLTAVDCGSIVNHKLATSQIAGGVVFGIGMALFEEAHRHADRLRILNDNLADYVLPVHADIGSLDVHFVEKPDHRFNEIGARGLGEIGLPGVAAAVGNAVFNATGRRCRSLPITPAFLAEEGPPAR